MLPKWTVTYVKNSKRNEKKEVDVFAETVFKGEPNKIAAPFSIERHFSGALVDEAAAAAVAH